MCEVEEGFHCLYVRTCACVFKQSGCRCVRVVTGTWLLGTARKSWRVYAYDLCILYTILASPLAVSTAACTTQTTRPRSQLISGLSALRPRSQLISHFVSTSETHSHIAPLPSPQTTPHYLLGRRRWHCPTAALYRPGWLPPLQRQAVKEQAWACCRQGSSRMVLECREYRRAAVPLRNWYQQPTLALKQATSLCGCMAP